MAEVLFYHLEARPLDAVLPQLLEKTLERGWRAVVEIGSTERAQALDRHLWTYREDSFLPHGLVGDGHEADQPILLTTDEANINNASVRFFVDGAVPRDSADYLRLVFLFSGQDEKAVADARQAWVALRGASHQVTYWQQDANGRWQKRA